MADPNMTPEMKKFIEDEVKRRLKLDSSVNDTTTNLPMTSKILKLESALSSTIDFVIKVRDRAQQATDSIASLYKTGVVVGSDQILQTADEFGVEFPQLTELLTKHSMTVAKLGIPTVTKFAATLKELSTQGATFGMSLQELQDGGLQYLNILNLTGRTQRYTTEELANNSVIFTKSLLEAAQVTGKSTEQIAASIKAKTEEANTAFLLATMNEQQAKNLNDTIQSLEKFNVGSSEAYNMLVDQSRAFISQGVSGLSDSFSTMLSMTGTFNDFAAAASELDPAEKVRKFEAFSDNIATALAQNSDLQIYQDEEWAKQAGLITQARNLMGEVDGEQPLKPLDEATKNFIENINKINNSVTTVSNAIGIGALAAVNNFKDEIATAADGAAKLKHDTLIPITDSLLDASNAAGILTTGFMAAYKLLQDTFGTDILPNFSPNTTSRDRQDVTPTTAPPEAETTPQPIDYETPEPTTQEVNIVPVVQPVQLDLRDYIIPAVAPVNIDLRDYIVPATYEMPKPIEPTAPKIEPARVVTPDTDQETKLHTDNTAMLVTTLKDTHAASYEQMSMLVSQVAKMIAQITSLNTNLDNQTSTLKHAINDNSGVII